VYALKEKGKNLPGMSGLLNVIAETELMAGNIDDAEQTFQQSWTVAQEVNARNLQSMVLSTGISIALERHENADAEARLRSLEDIMQFQSISWMWHKIQMTRGLLKLRSGATDEAESMFLTGLKVAEEKGEYG
jgi:hypothetical protein